MTFVMQGVVKCRGNLIVPKPPGFGAHNYVHCRLMFHRLLPAISTPVLLLILLRSPQLYVMMKG